MEPFSHLLHSGILPTAQEHAAIYAAKQTYEKQRLNLRKEISRLRARLNQAQTELDATQQEIDKHARLISPLRRIPPEIFRDIFAFASPAPETLPITDVVLHAPWTLLQVCKHWNEVCLTYGSLWSQVVIDTRANLVNYVYRLPKDRNGPYYPGSSMVPSGLVERTTDILKTQLQRSKDADLSVTIRTKGKHDDAHLFLRPLLPHLHRARYLKAPYHILAGLSFSSPLDRLDHLETDYSYDRESMESTPGPSHTPHHSLRANRTYSATFSSHLFIQSFHPLYDLKPDLLTSVGVETSCWQALKLVLPQMESLTKLELFGEANRDVSAESFAGLAALSLQLGAQAGQLFGQDRIILPRLSTLIICRTSGMPQPLDSLQTPSLTNLAYTGTLEVPDLVDFLSASACKLRTLKLHPTIMVEPIVQLFTIHPDLFTSVRWLELSPRICTSDPDASVSPSDSEAFGTQVISIFTHSIDIFPQLRHLLLHRMVVPAPAMVDMLESRRRPVEPGVQLASCTLTDLLSQHRLFSPETLAAMAVKTRVTELHSGHGSDAPWSRRSQARIPRPTWETNPPLTWAEGLEREPEQKARLEKLQDDGLEVYMDRSM